MFRTRVAFRSLLFFALLTLSHSSFCQTLVGTWLAMVDGNERTRTLLVTNVTQKTPEIFSLDAEFGWTDEEEPVTSAEVIHKGETKQLLVTAKSGAKIVADLTPEGNFVGSFLFKNGQSKGVKISRVSDLVVQKIEKPGVDVPVSCAIFSGHWSGFFTQGNIGQMWLWVGSIDSNCKVKFRYLSDSRPPKRLAVTEIRNGEMSFICSPSTGGVCTFKPHGDDLWVSYSNPGGGSNSGVFKKQQ